MALKSLEQAVYLYMLVWANHSPEHFLSQQVFLENVFPVAQTEANYWCPGSEC